MTASRADTSGPARRLPETGPADLLRLCLTIAGGVLRHPLSFSAGQALREWTRQTGARHGSTDFVLRIGSKRLVIVGSQALSRAVLDEPPREDGISAGTLKRGGMSFLAPQALTITNDAQWQELRALNERVLEPGRPHADETAFLAAVRRAFDQPVSTVEDIRAAMSRTMADIVFGPGVAPASIGRDVAELFGYVQSPLKRKLLAPIGARRRARFRAALRTVCEAAAKSPAPSLVARAVRASTRSASDAELLDQVPHWMFTFTGSGTDLVVRALALVCGHSDARKRAREEIVASGSAPGTEQARRLTFLNACVREAAYLYPPVTRTFHRARDGATVGGAAIPAGTEIVSSFPAIELGRSGQRAFDPARWLEPSGGPTDFDPFLTGPRHCPGQDLIRFVCTVALAELIGRQDLRLAGRPFAPNDLPVEFPARGISFRKGGTS